MSKKIVMLRCVVIKQLIVDGLTEEEIYDMDDTECLRANSLDEVEVDELDAEIEEVKDCPEGVY